MDTLRGNFADRADSIDEVDSYDAAEEESGREALSSDVGQDERRMQVRAYNHWASLLEDRNFPSIDHLEPEQLPDFAPYSVLLDFTAGVENPGISFLGESLAEECGAAQGISELADVPSRSLLSRITDHYMQILANQAPIGFEAEFVNQRGRTILYRGILLPFSSDDETIDFIYGVINWKELADQHATDELMLEIDQALDEDDASDTPSPAPAWQRPQPVADWADGPVSGSLPMQGTDGVVDLAGRMAFPAAEAGLPMPHFGGQPGEEYEARGATEIVLPEIDESEMGLGDWLASARELAEAARSSEDRSRSALYAAIGRAYDFCLAAAAEPEEYRELVIASGLTMQDRAPMTPLVKLVFGADYDKTRLTEYATALTHAQRIGLERGMLAAYLAQAEGGLKGVVKAERLLRREESGKPAKADTHEPRAAIARKLRKIAPMGFEEIPSEGHEFGLVMIRRLPTGQVAILGEVSEDTGLIERAARKLCA